MSKKSNAEATLDKPPFVCDECHASTTYGNELHYVGCSHHAAWVHMRRKKKAGEPMKSVKRTRFEIAAEIISQGTYSEDSRLFQDVASALSLKLSGQMLDSLKLLIDIKCSDAVADAIASKKPSPGTARRELDESGKVVDPRKTAQDRKYADKWAGWDCTLNGKPAMILGRKLQHGVVAAMDASNRAEFSWSTIDRIMTSGGGAFKS